MMGLLDHLLTDTTLRFSTFVFGVVLVYVLAAFALGHLLTRRTPDLHLLSFHLKVFIRAQYNNFQNSPLSPNPSPSCGCCNRSDC